MKYVKLRGNTYYYRRRIPSSLNHLSTIKVIYRPLSTDKSLAKKISTRYDTLFNMIVSGLKLGVDVGLYIAELGLNTLTTADIFQQYLDKQEAGKGRLKKISMVLSVIRELLPKDLATVNMTILDSVRSDILRLPRRSLAKYKDIDITKLLSMKVPEEDRISTLVSKSYLVVLNAFIKYLYEREIIHKQYSVKLVKKDRDDRTERVALSVASVSKLIAETTKPELQLAYKLLYLTGLRPSEACLCKITYVGDVKCFDLRDTSIKLKTKSSHRLIPIHKSIDNPEEILEYYKSMSSMMISRGFKKVFSEATLYSLRHSFATQLASKGIEPHIISELLGHTHNGMTLGRYVKGFPTKLLSESINKLDAV